MATEADLLAEMEGARQDLETKKRQHQQYVQDVHVAEGRQRLRRELDGIRNETKEYDSANVWLLTRRQGTDADRVGPHIPSAPGDRPARKEPARYSQTSVDTGAGVLNCCNTVARSEYVWKIEGLSWLENTLRQLDEECAVSEGFRVGGECFIFVYHPKAGVIGERGGVDQRASLAIQAPCSDQGITFRYGISIKRRGGSFEPWGDMGNECHPDTDTSDWVFGPDVQLAPGTPSGIFGLTHTQLVASDWVENDTLTIKFQLELRPDSEAVMDDLWRVPTVKCEFEVSPSTICSDFLSLFEKQVCADVTFIVGGETIKAHSQILCARSEVFERQFNGSLRESVTKEVLVEDCDAVTFTAMLKFIYTDDMDCVKSMVNNACLRRKNPTETAAGSLTVSRVSLLQNVLAISHKYQLSRMGLWCEQQLCECLTVDEVCTVLCKAHLYDGKKLEKACLAFIKEHFADVVATPTFGSLAHDWPDIMIKVSVFLAGVCDSSAGPSLEVPGGCKRKRDE